MILNKANFDINATSLVNYIFCLFPLSFILGNFAININLVLFCCLGLYHLRSKILSEKFNFLIKIIFLFFLIIIFSTVLSFVKSIYFESYEFKNLIRLIKSIVFLRFFLLLITIYLLSKYDILNFKFFFISASIFPLLISFDVIFQYLFGFNFVGLKSYGHHNSSFFEDELISGGFIQNFSFFTISYLSFFFMSKKNYFKYSVVVIATSIMAIGILVSGNKMPFILFLFGLFLIFLLNKKMRIALLTSYLIIFLIFTFISSVDKQVKSNYMSFYGGTKAIVVSLIEKIKEDPKVLIQKEKEELLKHDPERLGHKRIFFTSLETWKLSKIFGNGIKSFREDCIKIERGMCSNHPHNYYLEILTDLGVIGLFLAVTIAFIIIIFFLKNYKYLNQNNRENLFLLAAIISLFMEVFPFKSSGSIFTTNNTSYIFILLSIILCYEKLLKVKNKK